MNQQRNDWLVQRENLSTETAGYRELEVRRETALKGLQGMAETDFALAFEQAISGVHALGISQITLLSGLFGGVFTLTFLLSLLHWWRTRA